MDKLRKIQAIQYRLQDSEFFRNFDVGLFRGVQVLSFDYLVTSNMPIQAFFVPDCNGTVIFLPTDDSMTDAQWTYVANTMNDMMKEGRRKGLVKNLYDSIYDKRMGAIAVTFPMMLNGQNMIDFDVSQQYQAILDSREEYVYPFYKFYEGLCKDFEGRKPSSMKCGTYVSLLNHIRNKDDLIRQVLALFYVTAGIENVDGSLYAVISTNEISKMFKSIMKDYPEEKKEILMGIKKYYSASTWFSLSEEGLREFFEDVHKAFVNDCCK